MSAHPYHVMKMPSVQIQREASRVHAIQATLEMEKHVLCLVSHDHK